MQLKAPSKSQKNFLTLNLFLNQKNINRDDINKQIKIINDTNLKNCEIIRGGQSFNYIKDSKAVIKFNSISILEGVGCRKKLLYLILI